MWGARRLLLLLLPAEVASWHDPPVHRVPLGVLRACRWHLVLLALDLLVMMALVVGHVAHVVGVRLVWSGRRGAVVAVQLLLRVVLPVVMVVLMVPPLAVVKARATLIERWTLLALLGITPSDSTKKLCVPIVKG